jgi:hypothetical protein
MDASVSASSRIAISRLRRITASERDLVEPYHVWMAVETVAYHYAAILNVDLLDLTLNEHGSL